MSERISGDRSDSLRFGELAALRADRVDLARRAEGNRDRHGAGHRRAFHWSIETLVVGSPALLDAAVSTPDQLRAVNGLITVIDAAVSAA
jgi:hypothetical protein